MIEKNSWFSKSRVETFSDGVFAIVVTLLVLEIKVPVIKNHESVGELYRALFTLSPKLLSWIMSFAMVTIIWVNHHRLLESINYINHAIFWINSLLLLSCSFVPFPTALVGDYFNNPVSHSFFGIVMAIPSFVFVLLRLRILHEHDLLKSTVARSTFRKGTRDAIWFGPVLYLTGAGLAWLDTRLALAVFLFIPAYFIFFNIRASRQL